MNREGGACALVGALYRHMSAKNQGSCEWNTCHSQLLCRLEQCLIFS